MQMNDDMDICQIISVFDFKRCHNNKNPWYWQMILLYMSRPI